jgi:hypothetical protein
MTENKNIDGVTINVKISQTYEMTISQSNHTKLFMFIYLFIIFIDNLVFLASEKST